MTSDIALACAAAAAASYAVGSVLQSIGARRSAGLGRTLRDPAYLVGLVADLAAWLASLVALRALPLFVVQTVLAGSLAVTVVLARVVLGTRLRRVDVGAVAVTLAALVVLAASPSAEPVTALSSASHWLVALLLVPVAVAGWAAVRRAWVGGAVVVAGIALGAVAICARAVTLPTTGRGGLGPALWHLAQDPLAWALLGYGAVGTLLYAASLQHGEVGRVTAVLWTVEVVVPSVVGVFLLGDAVKPGWWPAAVLAILAAIAAATVLASAPARDAGDVETGGSAERA